MGRGPFLDLSADDLARFRLPFGLLEELPSDYFVFLFSSSLQLENAPPRSRQAMVVVNLKSKCDPSFTLGTSSTSDRSSKNEKMAAPAGRKHLDQTTVFQLGYPRSRKTSSPSEAY
jgi:hypothetical protein